jgi:hypothetical protein
LPRVAMAPRGVRARSHDASISNRRRVSRKTAVAAPSTGFRARKVVPP